MLEEILQMLEGKALRKVESETGLSYYWLRRIVKGEVLSPNLTKLETLYKYLKTNA